MSRKLCIIGAGQKYDLITLRGLDCLKKADIVLYDRLIDKKILDFTNAEKIDVGKLPYKHGFKQVHINDTIKSFLLNDKHIVRLKGGDSTIFSRSIEEIKVARDVGASVEIIPGVTAASSTAARINCALTDRNLSSGVIFITGHQSLENLEKEYNWKAIVQLKMTIVIYMGIKNMGYIANRLIECSLSRETAALIAEKIEMENERLLFVTLDKIEETIKDKKVEFPAVVIIGDVLKYAFGSKEANGLLA